MKAFTVYQPYAHAIVAGVKHYETRPRRTHIRGRVAVHAGRLDEVPETLIDAASAVSGCGPAWVYQFIEALADGGVAAGLPRAKAQEYAAQMLLGSARMVLETGRHPGELKDMVCSPGGTTIQAVKVLEEKGMRAAVMDAMDACIEKSKSM